MIRVLVAEDSDTSRAVLVEILRADPDIEIVGEARDGIEAVALVKKLKPDLVTMDILMPKLDGFGATKQIMSECPMPIVIVSALQNLSEGEAAGHAMAAGALTVLRKPPSLLSPEFRKAAQEFVITVKAMSQVLLPRTLRAASAAPAPAPARPAAPVPAPAAAPKPARARQPTTPPAAAARVVTITTSTGGPAALEQILPALPKSFTAPIVIVQHMTKGFIEGLARAMSLTSGLDVKLAEAGERLRPRTVYLAPDDQHIGFMSREALKLSIAAPIKKLRPSATYLFQSAARVFGAETLAIVLTGWGDDGIEGLKAVRKAGGTILAQDESSSVLFSLPGAAIAAGLPDVVLPITAIAERMAEMTRR